MLLSAGSGPSQERKVLHRRKPFTSLSKSYTVSGPFQTLCFDSPVHDPPPQRAPPRTQMCFLYILLTQISPDMQSFDDILQFGNVKLSAPL